MSQPDVVTLWGYLKHFRLVFPPPGAPGYEMGCALQNPSITTLQDWLRTCLQCPALTLVDFRRGMVGSRPCIHFEVSTLGMAEAVVRQRHRLKAFSRESQCPVAIFDVLSPEEAARHKALYPRFLEAIKAGRRAQFSRALLRIDGHIIRP